MFIKSDAKGNVYKSLIDLAFDVCDEFILVVRKDPGLYLNENGISVLERLKGSLKKSKEQSEWVSNKLFGQNASVYYYTTDNQARKILKEVSNSLHSWVQPNLPEDLSFIKNGNVWLINNAHEIESYIETDNEEELIRIKSIDGLDIRF